jgi:NAD-dependent SIR2 family protein deacetylase
MGEAKMTATTCANCGGKKYDVTFVARGGDGYAPKCPSCGGTGLTPAGLVVALPPCETCGGVGWNVEGQTIGWPYGEQVQCADCSPLDVARA